MLKTGISKLQAKEDLVLLRLNLEGVQKAHQLPIDRVLQVRQTGQHLIDQVLQEHQIGQPLIDRVLQVRQIDLQGLDQWGRRLVLPELVAQEVVVLAVEVEDDKV